MNKQQNYLLLTFCLGLISCMSESGYESATIELQSPHSDRQILAVDDRKWRVDIDLNTGSIQTFYFGDVNSPTAVVQGIRRNEPYSIKVKWSEIIHQYEVEISEQSQNFFADGITQITSVHEHTQFDYDNDGKSNLDERSARTCVWSPTENCQNQGVLDIPTDNVLLNGDFSNGGKYWFSTGGEQGDVSGEFCAFSPASAAFYWGSNLGYSRRLFIEANTRYRIVFDVRAERESQTYIIMSVSGLNFNLLSETRAVSTNYQTITVPYISADDSYNDVTFSFSYGNGTDNRYCFDNVRLIRDGSI